MRPCPLFMALLAVAAVVAGCSRGGGQTPAPERYRLTVFAASSLTEAFEDVATAFEAEHPGVDVEYNFAGSSTLVTQLLNGAQADVLAAADPPQAQRAVDAGLALDQPADFATNRLVVVTPASDTRVRTLQDLAGPGVRVVVALPDVPAGAYSRQALRNLEALPDLGPGYADRVLGNVVSEEPNVRVVLSRVSLGEADAGIVYATDVTEGVADRVRTILLPDSVNGQARYPAVALKSSARPDLARAFVDFLRAEGGQTVLREHGFGPP